ncbi:MAG TPA: GAF domain-containing protein [Acidimicrobiia bacterium]|nr:GAF domain-containing protein [Acidimicrobiia bacterium]
MTTTRLAALVARLGRCADVDTVISAALAGLATEFGYEHSLLLLVDETASSLYTIASHGYAAEGVGSEVRVGEGIIGMAAARVEPMRVGNLGQMLAYARTVRRSYEEQVGEAPGREIPLPGLADAESQIAAPAVALGQLLGVLVIESAQRLAFGPDDEAVVSVVAAVIAAMIEIDTTSAQAEVERAAGSAARRTARASEPEARTRVRFFAVDGSTFLDGDYLIKGVAGRILWALLGQFEREGREEFTNKEVRLDPTLELPEFRANLESRLILLKRRLDERAAPIRIERAGRGRFRLVVERALQLEQVASPDDA